jgi:hypothetical protein
MKRVIELTAWLTLLAAVPSLAQSRPQTPPPPPPGVTPQPVGRGGDATPTPRTTAPPPATPRQAPASQQAAPRPAPASPSTAAAPRDTRSTSVVPVESVPTEAQLGVPIFPGAKFLRSYDAGQGQRYYLFGATASFAELVLYYKSQLKKGGDLVYDEPPVHMFEVGRFREETMAFPPGVTVKDYTWGGSKGYLVPTPGASPSRYPTIIQIVPVVAGR